MDTPEHAQPRAETEGRQLPRRALRARIARRQASHSYVSVLVLIVSEFLIVTVSPNTAWIRSLLLLLASVILLDASWASGLTRGRRPPFVFVGFGAAALAFLQLLNGGAAITGTTWIVGAVCGVATAGVLVVGVLDQDDVNLQSVLGAVCVYLLLGLIFTQAFGAIAALGDGPLFAQPAGDATASVRLYFSYVTLATLGYGDYTPAAEVGRTFAIVEALAGQLYLVTVVAVLVSRIGRGSRA
jgi:voltage-gated potassium channel Kch